MDRLESVRQFESNYVAARRVDVWLPPGYETAPERRFGVLYMHDGQNLFDPATAYGGVDWGVVPALLRLIAAGSVPEVLVVGIANTERRWEEYLPQRPFATPEGPAALARLAEANKMSGEVLSDAYLRFMVEELKPYIDGRYRTLPGPAHTVIMGSSMGGLISLYGLCEYPAVFGRAGCVSTHWPAVEGVMVDYLRQALPAPGGHRLYFDYGTETLDALYEPYQQEVDAILLALGFRPERDFMTRRFEGADHSEGAWRARVDIPLAFLLG